MKNIFIVAISVEFGNARKVCEWIESESFENMDALVNRLKEELEPTKGSRFTIYELTDFMDDCNDQYLDLESVFISYVKIENL